MEKKLSQMILDKTLHGKISVISTFILHETWWRVRGLGGISIIVQVDFFLQDSMSEKPGKIATWNFCHSVVGWQLSASSYMLQDSMSEACATKKFLS